MPGLIVVKRLIMQGFIVTDFNDQREKALAELQSWVASGKIKVQEDVINGLENTPAALIGLLAGENRGKRMVKVYVEVARSAAPTSLRGAKRRSNPARAKRANTKARNSQQSPHFLLGALRARLDCFASLAMTMIYCVASAGMLPT